MSPIVHIRPLGFPWVTEDPFLFCVHHDDAYPPGNDDLGPAASLRGRNIGQDFEGKDGWRMYHGDVVPGFPAHPHRGFETVTIVRRGFVDHSDSLGATARFGRGDVQWMTAGRGIVHSEMFPLLSRTEGNKTELFQIWLNLPPEDKLVEPHFSMLWDRTIPRVVTRDEHGRAASLTNYAGRLPGELAPPPPPRSWAARPDTEVAIWSFTLEPHARFVLPRASKGVNRTLYFFRGARVSFGPRGTDTLEAHGALKLREDLDVTMSNGPDEAEFLLLQGRPIDKPVVQYGPFVMNTRAEIERAFADYRQTRFGGWPWPSPGPVHARDAGRFARHANGHAEKGDETPGAQTSTV